MNENNIIGAILAGGKSQRMGQDKLFLKLNNKTLIEHTIDKVKKYLNKPIIITNLESEFFTKNDLITVKDCIGGQLGPLVGILTAMKWAKENSPKVSWIATFPCDTPFFDNQIFKHLLIKSKRTKKKLFFFKSGEKRHNIFGLWSLELEKILEKDIKNNHRKVEAWANKIGLELIEIDKKKSSTFLNINTREDLKKAKIKIKK